MWPEGYLKLPEVQVKVKIFQGAFQRWFLQGSLRVQ